MFPRHAQENNVTKRLQYLNFSNRKQLSDKICIFVQLKLLTKAVSYQHFKES